MTLYYAFYGQITYIAHITVIKHQIWAQQI